MELEKFEAKQVAEISELQATSNQLRGIAKSIKVTDNDMLKEANSLVKDINAHKKLVKEKRLALTQPLNNVINQLIAKEKEVLLPLDEGKSEVSTKILDYSEELERKRLEEARRIETITEKIVDMYDMRITDISTVDKIGANLKAYFVELPQTDQENPTIKVAFMTTISKLTDLKNQIREEARAEAERVRQAEEQKRLDAAAEKQSAEEARIAAERKEVDDQKRQIAEDKAQMIRDKEELERQKEIQKAEAEALKLEKANKKADAARPKTNQITSTKFEVTDEDAVDRIYCSPDEKKIREAIKIGMKQMTGIRIFTETKVR